MHKTGIRSPIGWMEFIRQLQEADDRSRANKKRIDHLEEAQKALTQMAKSVAVLANEQKNISEKLDCMDSKVDELEHKPGKRWDAVVDKIVLSVLAALVAWMLAKVGIAA